MPICKHQTQVPCFVANRKLEPIDCRAPCPAILPCGHACVSTCGGCVRGHPPCASICKKTLQCGHQCPVKCHGDQACPPCQTACRSACSHSKCSLKCDQPCPTYVPSPHLSSRDEPLEYQPPTNPLLLVVRLNVIGNVPIKTNVYYLVELHVQDFHVISDVKKNYHVDINVHPFVVKFVLQRIIASFVPLKK